ncbi:GntR family transcriptional regulator [Pseudalkalibacillus sp. SCS-8]|uniref:GntR family transcriptional regulator n=1 Tax=Pseudalkalibacillus nanhaiensis TaxID=3115291 RepID=UPI0032DA6DEE
MKPTLDESQPIFHQIASMIKNDIIDGRLQEGERVPSTNDLSRFYNINPATARKGLQSLVDANIIYKQRGVGMFVKEGARHQLLDQRKKEFYSEYVAPLLQEAKRINLSTETVIELISKHKGEEG